MGKSTTFAARMAMAVKETGKSLQAIADEAGTSKGQVSQWQTEGKVQPESVKADVVERICLVLGVRPRWLLYGEAPMRPAAQPESFISTAPNCEIFTPSSSHLLRPDPAIVRDANKFLTWKFAEANDANLLFDLDKHAELFSLAYQWVSSKADSKLLPELTRAINHAMEGAKHGSERDGGDVSGGRNTGAGAST